MMEERNREYFKGINYKVNEVICVSEAELIIPDGYHKQLNNMEKHQLINDQLLRHGLALDNMFFFTGGKAGSRIVSASKNAKHIEHQNSLSSRLREYLETFEKMGNKMS